MKLVSVELCGIGPFARKQFIDFERFSDSGLFLLRGSTGSGKTTLIDSIVFALYGDVASGSDGAKSRLRSLYCAPDDPSYVIVVFEVSSGMYRVRRTPQYQKEGRATPVNTTIVLEKVVRDPSDSSGLRSVEALSRSIVDAQSMITSFIGLTKDQFLQTVVLPQGQFARFLTSKSSDREKILRDIFGTRFFQTLQEAFREEAKSASDLILRTRQQARSAVSSLLEELSLSPLSEECTCAAAKIAEAIDGYTGGLWLGEQHTHVSDQITSQLLEREEQAESAQTSLQSLARQRNSELNDAKQLNERLSEFTELCQRRDALADRSNEIASLRINVKELQLLQPLELPLAQYDSARLRLESAHEVLAEHFSVPEDSSTLLVDTADFSHTLSEMADKLRIQRDSFERALHIDEECTRLDIERTALSSQHHQCTSLLSQLEEKKTDNHTQREVLLARFEEVEHARSTLVTQENTRNSLMQRLEAAQLVANIRTQLNALEEEILEATRTAHERGQEAHRARELWLRETAASLAAELHDGSSCPVCGSTSHPSPAQFEGTERISREGLEQRERAQKTADQNLHELLSQRSAYLAQIDTLAEQAGDQSESLKSQLDTLTALLQDLQATASEYDSIKEKLKACEELDIQILTQSTACTQQRADLDEQLTLLDERLSRALQARETLMSGYSSLEQWKAALAQSEHTYNSASSSLTDYVQAAHLFSETQDFFFSSLKDAGFTADSRGISSLREQLPRLCALPEMREELEKFDRVLFATQNALASPRMSGLEGQSFVDCEALEGQVEEAEKNALSATQELASLRAQRASISRILTQVDNSLTHLRAAVESGYPKQRLAELANGTGASLHQVPLSSWILMSRFEELIAAANPRLTEISRGRYELRRSDTDATRSRKNGLGLSILDHESEEERSPSTLSGGEAFYVSLALALGLADVVMAESGGITLSSMFIDEGFGSLDLDTLDVVMAQLLALKESERCIGVISHVDEMARQIPDQILVSWSEGNGSTLSIRGA